VDGSFTSGRADLHIRARSLLVYVYVYIYVQGFSMCVSVCSRVCTQIVQVCVYIVTCTTFVITPWRCNCKHLSQVTLSRTGFVTNIRRSTNSKDVRNLSPWFLRTAE